MRINKDKINNEPPRRSERLAARRNRQGQAAIQDPEESSEESSDTDLSQQEEEHQVPQFEQEQEVLAPQALQIDREQEQQEEQPESEDLSSEENEDMAQQQQDFQQQLQALQQQLQQLQQDNARLQQDVQNANANANAMQQVQQAFVNAMNNFQGGQPGQAQAQAQAAAFARSPAGINADNPIDYSSRAGLKIFETATEALPDEFDLSREDFLLFLENLENKSQTQSWQTLLTVPHAGTNYSVLEQYGLIPEEAWRAYALTYAFDNSRLNQNSCNLLQTLKATLTKHARTDLIGEKTKYTVQPPAGQAAGTRPFEDGLLFLKLIIDKTTVMTNASVSMLVEQLTDLETVMANVEYNISEFNTHVNSILRNFRANSATEFSPQVLYQQLIKAYRRSGDNDFDDFIRHTDEDHESGVQTQTPATLMAAAKQRYDLLFHRETWRSKSKDQQEIISLTAKLETQQKKLKSLEKKGSATTGKRKSATQKPAGSSKDVTKRPQYAKAPAWMKKAPTDGKGAVQRDGKTYYWCPTHKLWQLHKPDECRLKKILVQKKEKASNKTKSQDNDNKATEKKTDEDELELDANLAAIQEEQDALDYDL